jgi:HEAT repeat protein
MGSLTLIAREVMSYRRLARLRRGAQPASREFDRLVIDVAARIGLSGVPDVRVLAGDFSPLVLPAIGRAVLIVPAALVEQFSADQQRAIVAHELAHLRRGDHWVRVFETFATALMWWHPLLWLARRGLREAEEQCCDAWVVALMPDDRRTYADALVSVLERASLATRTFVSGRSALATGLGRMKHLRRRLNMIVDTAHVPARSLSPLGWLLVLALCALLPLAPVRGEDRVTPPAAGAAKSAACSAPAVDDTTRKAVESLLEMAQDENQQVQMAASDAIAQFGARAVPVLIDALAREKSGDAARTLLPRTGVEGIEALIEAVGSDAPLVRERALLTLETVLGMGWNRFAPGEGGMPGAGGGGYGPGVAPAFPGGFAGGFAGGVVPAFPPQIVSYASWAAMPVAKASADDNAAVRRAAVRVLAAISRISADPAVVDALGAALKDSDSSVRGLAAAALVNVARAAPQLARALAEAVGDPDQNVRIAALSALAAVGPAAKTVMPTVTAALKDPNSAVRIAAANALGAMQAAAVSPPTPPPGFGGGGVVDGLEGAPPEGDGNALAVAASNLWHWAKLGRRDRVKAEVDRIIKLRPMPQALFGALATVAHERNEDLQAWMKQAKDVVEMQPLVAQLQQVLEEFAKPPSAPEPAVLPSASPEAPSTAPGAQIH